MKKISLILTSIILIFCFTSIIKAQDFDYTRAYQDYVYNYDLYKKAHAEYDLKRSQYLQTGTLASQQEAQKATAAMLQARDQVLITYLTAIRLKMAETKGIDTTQRETYYSLIDGDVGFYTTHKANVSSAASLEDLTKDSTLAANQYKKSTELTVIKSLTLVSNGKIDNFQNQTNDIISALEGKINQIRANGDKKTDDPQRWILEVKNRVNRSTDKETEASALINKIKVDDKTKNTAFNQAQGKLAEGLQYLKEANSFLKQIIVNIKTADQ
jgi:hypothetical protein